MKKSRIIAPALGVLILSTAASITGTVAWFTANNSVQLTGMVVKTKVGSNILISSTNSEAAYAPGLNQSVGGLLEPVSSINGINFFYTSSSNVDGTGAHKVDTFTTYNHANTTAFDQAYSTDGAKGYADYSFYLKATNSENAARNLRMSICNLTYAGDTGTSNAWRVAVFAKETAKNAAAVNDEVHIDNLKTILRKSGAAYFVNENETPKAVAAEADDLEAQTPVYAMDAVNAKIDDAATVVAVDAGSTAYYKLTVRLWLEGEDTECNNETFASLTEQFRLDLKFDLSASAGVTNISSAREAVASASGATATVELSETDYGTIENGETASTLQWFNAANDTSLGDAVAAVDNGTGHQYTLVTADTTQKVYCVVTTNKANTYRTNTVTVTTVVPNP